MLLSLVILRLFAQKSAKQHYLVEGQITAAKIVSELTATEKAGRRSGPGLILFREIQ